jgi:hypothetical protein
MDSGVDEIRLQHDAARTEIENNQLASADTREA